MSVLEMGLRSVSLTEPSHRLLTTLKWVVMRIDQKYLRAKLKPGRWL